MISVSEATQIIQSKAISFGTENVAIEQALGRVLAQDICADRDWPPFDRCTMDGIAIIFDSWEKGNRFFEIENIQHAGEAHKKLINPNHCLEVMTGTVLPQNTDTVVRYEDISISNGIANVKSSLTKGQNIHNQGLDKKNKEVLLKSNTVIGSTQLAVLATVGCVQVPVYKLPTVAIVTSGDELVPVNITPLPFQIRRSNGYAIAALLAKYKIKSEHIHIPDNPTETESKMAEVLNNHDITIVTGGVSMGKKDYIPQALENIGVEKHFHKIAQKPGKPIWFGSKENKIVFALPGNPVSNFMCMVRYVMPFLEKCLNISPKPTQYSVLDSGHTVSAGLTHLVQVHIYEQNAQRFAKVIEGHGSGDYSNLLDVGAFAELPTDKKNNYKKGEMIEIWPW